MDIKAEEGQTIKNDIGMSENQEIAIYDGSENSKSIHFYKNNTVRLVNEFYGKFYSLKNLKMKDWYLIPLLLFFTVISIVLTFKLTHSSSNLVIYSLLIPYVISMIIYYLLNNRNEESIVEKYNIENGKNFKTTYETRNDWLIANFGSDYATLEKIKKLQEWKELREKHPNQFKFNWRVYTYTTDAKPRIVSYTIALITLLGLIVFNFFKPQNPDEMIAYIDAFIHTPAIWGIIIFILILLIFIFYSLVFSIEILKNLFYSFSLMSKNDSQLSEAKFKKLMSFIVNQLEV